MKRLSISILTLCLAVTATAGPVSKQAALYSAQAYMLAKGKTIDTSKKPFRARMATVQATDEETPYYYVFNAGGDGGYVIVSADDRTESILGYVEQGSFDPDNIPENMRSWLQFYADQIKYIVDNDIQPGSPKLKARNRVQATKHSIPELLSTRWNQGHPYNLTCPLYYKEDGTQAYPASGCVATAMAQVVNYYKFPERLKAVIPAHSCTYTLKDGTKKTVNLRAIPRNTVIDWDNMHDTYDCNDSHDHDRADTAVANLVLYCGQGVKMGYGASSGAVTGYSRDFFVNIFGYDKSAFWAGRGDYTIDQWFNMIYDELEAGYPVLFAGHSSGGGHAFVLDGFDGDNLFHVNWGWGGGSNGYFLVSILNPGDNSGIGASSSSDGYSMSQGALFSLRLPNEAKADSQSKLSFDDLSVSGTIIKGKWTNRTGSIGSFHTGIVMLEEDGSLTLVGTQQNITAMAINSGMGKTYNLKGKLPEGTYRLSPASKLATAKTWRTRYNMQGEYIEAVVDSAGVPTMRKINPVTSLSIDTIVFPGTRVVGKEQEVKVTYRNNGDEYFKEVRLFASQTAEKIYTESRSIVAVRKGETIDVSYFFTPDSVGTYNLWLCTGSDGSGLVGESTVEIIEASDAVKANLAVNGFTISNAVSGIVYGNRLTGKVNIKNNARTDFHGKVRIQIWSQKKGSNTAWSGSSRTVPVDIAAGRIASVDFDFEGLSDEYKYRLPVYYVNQDGNLSGGGLWDHGWDMNSGLLTWKTNGAIAGMARRPTITAASTLCGIYADCADLTRLMPNKNPNTIYAFANGMSLPASILESNAVCGGHADHINLVNDQPYYLPISFNADSASFTYTFPETEKGTGWHAFTLPFEADSIFLDSIPVTLGDSLNHFWIYEFAAQGNNGEIIFEPATILRGNTPYIIAADSTMAGRSLVFRSLDVPFYKTGSDKMVVTTPEYQFHGITYAPVMKDCYILNDEGTAFEYKIINTALTGLTSYFTTSLPDDVRLESIVLPEVPKAIVQVPGDLNGDAVIDIADAVSILNLMAGGAEADKTIADINKDGIVDIADFVMILNMMAGE